jgi:hypothetical protein
MQGLTMSVRAALSVIICCYSAGFAFGDCRPRLLGETPAAFLQILAKRLRPVGVVEIDRIGHVGGIGDHYLILGAKMTMFLTDREGMLSEIGLVLSTPASEAESEKQIIAAGFALAHLAETAERPVADRLRRSALSHKENGHWVEREGDAVAVFTRTGDGLVVKFGKPDCG